MRFCLSPALVSLRFSFHLADGLALFCLCFGFCFVWFALLLTGSSPSVAIVFESIAPLPFSPWGHLACLALVPHRPVFHLSCADFVSPVSPVSLAAKGFAWLWCFLVFLVLCGFCVWFGLFVCLLVVAFLFVSCFPLLLCTP